MFFLFSHDCQKLLIDLIDNCGENVIFSLTDWQQWKPNSCVTQEEMLGAVLFLTNLKWNMIWFLCVMAVKSMSHHLFSHPLPSLRSVRSTDTHSSPTIRYHSSVWLFFQTFHSLFIPPVSFTPSVQIFFPVLFAFPSMSPPSNSAVLPLPTLLLPPPASPPSPRLASSFLSSNISGIISHGLCLPQHHSTAMWSQEQHIVQSKWQPHAGFTTFLESLWVLKNSRDKWRWKKLREVFVHGRLIRVSAVTGRHREMKKKMWRWHLRWKANWL